MSINFSPLPFSFPFFFLPSLAFSPFPNFPFHPLSCDVHPYINHPASTVWHFDSYLGPILLWVVGNTFPVPCMKPSTFSFSQQLFAFTSRVCKLTSFSVLLLPASTSSLSPSVRWHPFHPLINKSFAEGVILFRSLHGATPIFIPSVVLLASSSIGCCLLEKR